MSVRDVLLALFVILLWGLNILVVKLGTQELPPFLLTGLRFILVAVLLVPIRRTPPKKLGLTVLLAVTMGVGHFGLLFAGIKGVGAATAAIALQLSVPFSALMSVFLYHEKLGPLAWFGMVLAIIGVAVVEGGPSSGDPLSLVMVIVSGLSWAISNIVVKAIGKVDILCLNGWMAVFAAPMVLGLSAIFETGHWAAMASASWAGWGAVLYTAIMATLVSYTVWYRLLARLSVNKVVPFMLLTPIIAVAGGGLLLGEDLTLMILAGGALTIVGVAAIQLRQIRAA